MTGVSLIESPQLKHASGYSTVLRVVTSPVETYRRLARDPRPIPILTGVTVLSVFVALMSAPVVRYLLMETPGVSASQTIANQFVLAQALLLTPFGTVAFLGIVALFLWAVVLTIGGETTLRHAAAIVFAAGAAGVLKRLFVACVLYLRWWLNPSQLGADVTTGLDGLLTPEIVGPLVSLIVEHAGIFDIWFVILVTLGLRYCASVPRNQALTTAGVTFGVVTTVRILVALAGTV